MIRWYCKDTPERMLLTFVTIVRIIPHFVLWKDPKGFLLSFLYYNSTLESIILHLEF